MAGETSLSRCPEAGFSIESLTDPQIQAFFHGLLGPLVPVGDVNALATAMEHTLDHPPDPRVLQTRGMGFSVDRAATAYETLLSSVVSAKRATPPGS